MKGKGNKKKSEDLELKEALKKRALGYDAKEVVEEYVSDEGEVRLTKKKVTTKNVPPDITALKILIEEKSIGVENMTDEELEKEKTRLLKLLAEYEKDN